MNSSFEALEPEALTLASGIVLHAVRQGSGTPLVMLHGAMGDWRSWGRIWPWVSSHFDCVSYSRRFSYPNPNVGASPGHGAFHEAEDLRELLDALKIPKAILLGSSYGAFTALAFAVRYPERVMALAAIEPPMMKYAERDPSPEGRDLLFTFRRTVIEPARVAFQSGHDERAAAILTGGIAGSGSPLTQGKPWQRRLQNVLAMKRLSLSSDEFPWIPPDQLASVAAPVLLVRGERTEPIHQVIFRQVAAAMPQAAVAVAKNSGHSVPQDQPEWLAQRLMQFIRESRPLGSVSAEGDVSCR